MKADHDLLLQTNPALGSDAKTAYVWRTALVIMAVALCWLFAWHYETARSTVSIWHRSETYTHGFIIFPISAYLIWTRRHDLLAIQPQPSRLGILALVLAGFGWLLADSADVLVAQQYALVAMVPLLVWGVLGHRVAYALLFPKGLLPQGYEIAVVQSRFFEASWGWWGKVFFLVIAAAFLSDTWLATVDAVSRTHADCVQGFFPRSQRIPYRRWYLFFLLLLTVVTGVTVQMNEPGTLILISAVIGFVGTVIYSVALILLNHVYLPRHLPSAAKPGKLNLIFMLVSCATYFVLAALYVLTVLKII